MIKSFFFGIFSLIYATSFSQTFKNDSVKSFIDTSINLIRSHAVDTSNIRLIESTLYSKSKDLNSVSDLAPLYTEVFELLKDHHGGLKYKGRTYGWNKPTNSVNAYVKNQLKTEKSVVSLVIDKTIAYMRIPGNDDFSFKKVDSIANDITSHINKANSAKIKAWIIDLRVNTGGNMYPILLGLKEFIGSDHIVFGGFRNSKGESTGKWEIRDGKMLIDGIELDRKTQLKIPIKKDIPVVILTSCYTASAGEMTAISLIGRKKTYIVGEPTADYTTAVQGFRINEDAGLNLSTDYVTDRNSKIYKSSIQPDIEVLQGDNLENLKKDKKILEALELLNR
ncbi:S41 family peptidase [Chryseobacterium arthrosphaerae]|uniref:S41 family peptidase n=1 Tax=Chryseobacterium arthrosphaerae TaxID=651561 RepID=UPI0023E1038A|nr:S41 family peptidase [Chryseobacterium arthrosphaerae]WES98215.1 S41 family peptidase [Chryseobacterium arthrosphaerae]